MNTLHVASPNPFTGRVVLAVILVLIALCSLVRRLREDRAPLASPFPPT